MRVEEYLRQPDDRPKKGLTVWVLQEDFGYDGLGRIAVFLHKQDALDAAKWFDAEQEYEMRTKYNQSRTSDTSWELHEKRVIFHGHESSGDLPHQPEGTP